jgi:hypothetical protein
VNGRALPRCRRCGAEYPWRGGISFAAVGELGRLIREHYDTAHPGVDPSLDALSAPTPHEKEPTDG